MHIAVLATTRNPLREPFAGGQEAQTASFTAGLRARGHTVRLYAQPGTDPRLADELATYAQVPTIRTPEDEPLAGLWRDDAAMSWAMADLVRRPVDLVHNQSLHHFPLAMSRAMPSTMVTTLHCPPYPLAEIGVSLAADDAVYVGVSEAVASMWRLLPIEPLVIHNGVRSCLFEFGSGGAELVWVGRITPEKGADLAIRAARTAGLPLTIVGPIADAAFYRDHVEPLLGDGVRHAGHLDQRATARIVGSSLALLVTPRWDEAFTAAVVEEARTIEGLSVPVEVQAQTDPEATWWDPTDTTNPDDYGCDALAWRLWSATRDRVPVPSVLVEVPAETEESACPAST